MTPADLSTLGEFGFGVLCAFALCTQIAYTASAPDIGRQISFDNVWRNIPLVIAHIIFSFGGVFFVLWCLIMLGFGLDIPATLAPAESTCEC